MNNELSLREIQLETLRNMKKIAEICEKENLNYCLAFGTLIGAVRHNGFIPWDDDLDIFMPRKDYENFKTYCITHKKELEPFELFTPETHSDYPNMIGRFCNTDFELIAENEEPCGMGPFVDIYPLDGFGSDYKKCKKLANLVKLPASCYFLVSRKHFVPTERKGLNLIKFVLYYVSKLCGKTFFYKKLMKWANLFDYESSKFVGCMIWLDEGIKTVFEKDDLINTEKHAFEDTEFLIPKTYDKILRNVYGDYMQLPPEEKRVGHHYYKIIRKA